MMQQQSPSPQPQGRGSRKQLCYTPMRPLFSGGVDYHHFATAENRICSPKQELQEAVVIPPALKRKSGMTYCGAESAEQNVGPGSSFVINGPQRTPVSGKAGKTQKVPRTPKAKAFSHSLVEVGSPAGSPSASCRYDSSLGLLTKKFINLIKRAEDGIIDLNNAADTLEVQKRRIYDITNVLEGIGLIEKTLKNRIQWKGMDVLRPGEDDESLSDLKEEIRNLNMEESSLDERIRQMQQNLSGLSEDEDNEKWLFVTEEDIKNLPFFQNETLIAIKAPHGTTLEVPDPDEAVDYPQRRYRIVLRSTMGPIDVYLVSQFEEKFEEINAVEPQPTILETSTVDETTVAPPPIPGVTGNELNVQGVDAQRMYPPTSTSQDFVGGITKIVPDVDSDADYWLMADANVSITDMWLNESGVDWNTLNALQEDYMSISPPQPQPQPQSPHPSRVSSVSNTNTGA